VRRARPGGRRGRDPRGPAGRARSRHDSDHARPVGRRPPIDLVRVTARGGGAAGAIGGVLVVDKPRGPTSHGVGARVRRALSTKRVGHAGTLDPMASGVLVVLVGEATKLAPYLSANDKTYRGGVALGVATDTGDADGAVVARSQLPASLGGELTRL